MTRDTVISTLAAALPDLKREFGVSRLYLFGSIARGEDRPESDADILVEFQAGHPVTLFTLARLTSTLEDRLARRVDVVEDHAHLRPSFREALHRDRLRVA